MTYVGADFSSWQGELPTSGLEHLDFAYIKATQGDNYTNPDAPQQAGALRGQGVEVGFYHFFDPTAEVGQQLLLFSRVAAALGGTKLPLALDSETADAAGFPTLATKMVQFAMGVESWTNYVPNPRSLLYVDLSFYGALEGFPWGRWVWLANPGAAGPAKPCLIWQSGQRPLGGSALTNVDWDQFMGTEADWQAFTGQPVTSQTPTTPPVAAPPAPKPAPAPVVAPKFPGRLLELQSPPIEGSDVRTFQAQMVHRGWTLIIDGIYGPATEAVVKAFQAQKGLKVDGIVGPLTWAAAWTAPITP